MDERDYFCFKERNTTLFLSILICTDLAFIGVHVLSGALSLDVLNFLSGSTSVDASKFSFLLINKDHGYAEIYQYIKEFWIILLILFVYSRTKENGHLAWSAVFLYLLFDDAIQIHERVGLMLADRLEFTPAIGLRPRDFGELTVTAVCGVVLITSVGFFYARGSADFKSISRDFMLLLSGVAFFGVFVDMADIAIKFGSTVTFVLETMEDGGEMIVMSMVVGYTFLLSGRDGHARFSLCELAFESFARLFGNRALAADPAPFQGVGPLAQQKREAA